MFNLNPNTALEEVRERKKERVKGRREESGAGSLGRIDGEKTQELGG